jgi:hypothetical protein
VPIWPGEKRYRHEGWEHVEVVLRGDHQTLGVRAMALLSDHIQRPARHLQRLMQFKQANWPAINHRLRKLGANSHCSALSSGRDRSALAARAAADWHPVFSGDD